MSLEQALLLLLFGYITAFLLLGLAKGRKYFGSYISEHASSSYLFHSVEVTLTLAGLAMTALALFVGFGFENLERVSSIILFFSISFVVGSLSANFARFPKRAYQFIGDVLADVSILAIGCGFLVFFDHELPRSYGLTFTYSLFIVVFLLLSSLGFHKYYRYWSLFNCEKEKLEGTSVNNSKSKKKFSFYEQAFLLFYGATIGLLAGVWGNLWATLFFEYIIKGDASLAFVFLVASLIFTAVVAILIILMSHFYNKIKEIGKCF